MDTIIWRSFSTKHIFHCVGLVAFIVFFEVCNDLKIETSEQDLVEVNPSLYFLLLLLKSVSFLCIPIMTAHFLGLVLWEAFPGEIRRRASPLMAPFLCFRIVTRGDFPDLVKNNVRRNIEIISASGLTNYMVEVVTDKPLNLPSRPRFRELVVPKDYATKTGAKFKARALQYCLEKEVNLLGDEDWIVHLDEETLLTENSVAGILNFASENKHDIGQGLITYASNEIVNWVTTLADSFRVSADMGAVRFSFKTFQRPLFIFKGSFVVARVGAERDVSFDNGAAGSIAEDCYFAMKAASKGYSFGWIEGEMQEKSPFNFWDFLQQRKRWLQGIFLVVHSRALPLRSRFWLGVVLYSWVTLPISLLNALVSFWNPVSLGEWAEWILTALFAVGLYMYIFGAIKSFRLSRLGFIRYVGCVAGAVLTMPLNILVETVAVFVGLLQDKNNFYVVDKQFTPVQMSIV